MVIIKAVFTSQNKKVSQTKFIGAGDGLSSKRYAQVFSESEAQAKINQLQKEERFQLCELTIESAIIEEVK